MKRCAIIIVLLLCVVLLAAWGWHYLNDCWVEHSAYYAEEDDAHSAQVESERYAEESERYYEEQFDHPGGP